MSPDAATDTHSVTWQCGVAVTVWERKLFKLAHVRRPLMERPEGVGSASLWLYLIFISVNLSAVVVSVKYQSCTDKMHLTRTLRNKVNSKSRRTEVIIKKNPQTSEGSAFGIFINLNLYLWFLLSPSAGRSRSQTASQAPSRERWSDTTKCTKTEQERRLLLT